MASNNNNRPSSTSSTREAVGRMAITAPSNDTLANGSSASSSGNYANLNSNLYVQKSASFRRWERKQVKEAEKLIRLEENRVAWRDRPFKSVGENMRGSQMELSVSATMRKVKQRLNYPRSSRQPKLHNDTWPGASQRFNVSIKDGSNRSKGASKSLDRKVKEKRIGQNKAKMTGRQRQDRERQRKRRRNGASNSLVDIDPKAKDEVFCGLCTERLIID